MRVKVSLLAVAVTLIVGFVVAVSFTSGLNGAAASSPCGTVVIPGKSWLGASGVDVRSNGRQQGTMTSCTSEDYTDRRQQDGAGWVPLELAARLYVIKGWGAVRAGGNGGAAYIPEGSPSLSFHANGSGYQPVPGDLVIFKATQANPFGQVAVIDSIEDGMIHTVEQGGVATERASLRTVGATVSGNVRGFAHSLLNKNDAGPGQGRATLALLARDGAVTAKQIGFGSSLGQATKVKAVAVATDPKLGPVLMVLTKGGRVFAKQGLTGHWVHQADGIRSMALAAGAKGGPSIIVLTKGGRVFAKQGLAGRWVYQARG